MSGHSHARTIAHDKGIADAKRGMAFSKFARMISIAAKNGKDPAMNSQLRMAIDKAREINMPTDNIERAIKRGAGELEGTKLEEFIFEAFGPGKIAIIIEVVDSCIAIPCHNLGENQIAIDVIAKIRATIPTTGVPIGQDR